MSDDLISRKALLERLETAKSGANSIAEQFFFDGVMAIIDTQPTAFDKEKVIEKLQRYSHNYYPSIDHYCLSKKAVALKDAIEIVEKGGVE